MFYLLSYIAGLITLPILMIIWVDWPFKKEKPLSYSQTPEQKKISDETSARIDGRNVTDERRKATNDKKS